MLPTNCDAYMAWDDDDVYFPEALYSVAKALEDKPWAQCRLIYESAGERLLRIHRAFKTNPKTGRDMWGYGGTWAYRLDALREVGGYDDNEARSSNDDIDLGHKFLHRYGESADSTSRGHPWYWYNRDPGVRKISDEGIGFWKQRASLPMQFVGRPNVGWNGNNMYAYRILPGIHDRTF